MRKLTRRTVTRAFAICAASGLSAGGASAADFTPLAAALAHTALQFVELSGVNHVLRDDPSDSISGYARKAPLSPQLTAVLDGFVTR